MPMEYLGKDLQYKYRTMYIRPWTASDEKEGTRLAIFIDPKNSSEEGAVLARYEENALFLWRV